MFSYSNCSNGVNSFLLEYFERGLPGDPNPDRFTLFRTTLDLPEQPRGEHPPFNPFGPIWRGVFEAVVNGSLKDEDLLYHTFGINAELLIDHAWGWEPTKISAIRSYRPVTNSLSCGQVLSEAYNFEKAASSSGR